MANELVAVDGARLRSYRKRLGWSQEMFADLAGISRSYLAEIELGRKSPRQLVADSLANALGVPVGLILVSERQRR